MIFFLLINLLGSAFSNFITTTTSVVILCKKYAFYISCCLIEKRRRILKNGFQLLLLKPKTKPALMPR